MVGLCLMASRGLGVFNFTELGFTRTSKNFQHVSPYYGPNQDFAYFSSSNSHLKQREERVSHGGFLGRDQLAATNSTWQEVLDVQLKTVIHPDSLVFGFGIAEQCTRQEKISMLLTSIQKEDGLLDPLFLLDLLQPLQRIMDPPQSPFSAYSTWCFSDADSEMSIVYPTRKFYLHEPLLDFLGHMSYCTENAFSLDCQLPCNCIGSERRDILSDIVDFYVPKDTIRSCERAMLVPYFERRRRAQSNTDSLKLATEKVAPLKSSQDNAMGKVSQKRKTSTRIGEERRIYGNNGVLACENLLSIIANSKRQCKSTILSVKRSGPQLTQLLTQFSATVAGAGIAVILSVACRVACSKASLCASKLLSTGLGLGLIWLSWAIINLRNSVISIRRSSSRLGAKEDEMMDHLDRNVKDIYFRAAALVAVAMLRLA